MKKIIMIGILSFISSVYASDVVKDKEDTKSESGLVQNKVDKIEIKNESFLYEFDFSRTGKEDKAIHKYLTNNTETVATIAALEDTFKKNWDLNGDYVKNLKLKSESKVANQLICKYNNGLVVKVKPYGDYTTNCPLKS